MIPWMVSGTWRRETFLARIKRLSSFLNGAVLQQVISQFLHEKGIAGGPVQDQIPQLGHHVSPSRIAPTSSALDFRVSCSSADPVVIGFASPLMGVFGAVEEKKENPGPWQPADHVVQELFRGLVDPMEIFYGQDQGPFLASPDQQVPDGLKGLFSSLFRFKLEKGLIIDLERQEFLDRRDDASEIFIQP